MIAHATPTTAAPDSPGAVPSVATLLHDHPEGLTRAQAEALSLAAGLDDLTAHWLWAAKSEPIELLAWRITTRHYLWLADRDGRRREILAALEAAGAVAAEFTAPDGWRYIAHPSSRTPGRYQLSRIDARGPVGHSEHASLQDAAASACCCSRLGHIHDDGDSAALLAATVDRHGRLTHHG